MHQTMFAMEFTSTKASLQGSDQTRWQIVIYLLQSADALNAAL